MDPITPTTPFGRRPLSLAMLGAQALAKACPPDAPPTHKWRVLRAITEAKDAVGVGDRTLAVLAALLSFHPETALTAGEDLVVFPSNRELGVRSHGMAPATLRRHLAALVEAGLIIRRDSPNGKRYARRDHNGEVASAFGFDLGPLVARAAEFETLAALARAERAACAVLREQISILRRDVEKLIEAAAAFGWPGPWPAFAERLLALSAPLPRSAGRATLAAVAEDLRDLRAAVEGYLPVEEKESSANESRPERQYQNSKADPVTESEPGFQESQGATSVIRPEPEPRPDTGMAQNPSQPRSFPLGMVLQACPDIAALSRHGVSHWRDLIANAELARPALGISPDAWADAKEAFGEADAAVVVAAILQRADAIRSPGGYLRALTEKARAGQFSLGPVLMALLRTRMPSPRPQPGPDARGGGASGGGPKSRSPARVGRRRTPERP